MLEMWDLYNGKREKTGRVLPRGVPVPKGLYHITCRLSENPGKTWRQGLGYAIIKLSEPPRRTQAWDIFKEQIGTR